MSREKIYLPSMTIEDMEKFVIDNSKDGSILPEYNDIAVDLLNGVYDHYANISGSYIPFKESNIANLLKVTKMASAKETPDTAIKATANDLRVLLSQSSFGVTGLWVRMIHSGFSIKLKPINAVTRVNLQADIANGVISFNRIFSGDIYTSVYVNAEDKIVTLFLSLIDYTTFDVPAKKGLVKFIKTLDLNLMKIAILALMYPNGYDGFTYICSEHISMEANDGSKKEKLCGRESTPITIDITEMVYIQNDLTDDEIKQLSITHKNALTEKDVLDYQSKFKYNKPTIATIDENIGMKITADAGYVYNYLTKSKKWLSEVILTSNVQTSNDIEMLVEMVGNSVVGKYWYGISRLETENYFADESVITLDSILTVSSNPELANKIIKAIKENILDSAYTIAVPKYVCPECKTRKKQEEADIIDSDNDQIEESNNSLVTNINVLDLFISLV